MATFHSEYEPTESQVLDAVCQYLDVMGFFFFRVNNNAVYDTKREVFRKHPKWAVKGVPDVVVMTNGKVVFVEVKTPKGVLSVDQRAFREMCKQERVPYHVVRCVADIQEIFPTRAV